MYFQNHVLREILNLIELDERSRRKYGSKWYSVVNFLFHNTGLPNIKIAQAGSIAKNIEQYAGDLEVKFCVSPDRSREQVYPRLSEKFQAGYKEVARVSQKADEVHINFNKDVEIDVVLLPQNEFVKQYKGVEKLKDLNQTQPDAIKLIKFAFDQAKVLNVIPGYKIEKTAFSLSSPDLAVLLEQLINQLNFDINRAGLSTFNVISYLK